MSRSDKLLKRLFSRPKDFEWDELKTLLTGYGYKELSGKGSRVKFFHKELDSLISLHKPHPGNIIKQYLIDQIIEKLKEKGIQP